MRRCTHANEKKGLNLLVPLIKYHMSRETVTVMEQIPRGGTGSFPKDRTPEKGAVFRYCFLVFHIEKI
jgi:hypothetical protein